MGNNAYTWIFIQRGNNMGYLNKQTVTVDAVLTKRGRELLAQGRSAFRITKFAVSDDEVDYGLYNLAHPLGSEYYGSAIENMPVVEASTDDAQNLRYKLVTLDRALVTQINVIPQISVGVNSITLTSGQVTGTPIQPSTSANLDGPAFGYTATLLNASAALIEVQGEFTGVFNGTPAENTQVAVGTAFVIRPKDVSIETQTVVIITGNQSGASVSIPITILPAQV